MYVQIKPREPPEGDLAEARRLILAFGWNATAYQILNPGMRLWFSRGREAVIGYFAWGRVKVVAGAPVCRKDRLPDVAAEFESAAAGEGCRVCYFAVDAGLQTMFDGDKNHCKAVIGMQPVWNPGDWPAILASHASLRAQLYRARNKSLVVREWSAGEACDSSAVRHCLEEWLASRRMPAMGFLVEPQTLSRLWDRRIFVAEQHGAPVGFLVATPVPLRNGWLIEQIIRGRKAPNGTAESLIDAAFRAAHAVKLDYFTLGLVPLSRQAPFDRDNPAWLNFLFGWMRAHGSRFYNFEGLEQFKAKFHPMEWEPVFAVCNEPAFTPGTWLAVAAAFGGRAPFRFLTRSLVTALRQEMSWMRNKTLGH